MLAKLPTEKVGGRREPSRPVGLAGQLSSARMPITKVDFCIVTRATVSVLQKACRQTDPIWVPDLEFASFVDEHSGSWLRSVCQPEVDHKRASRPLVSR